MRLSGSLTVLLAGVTSLVSAVPFVGPSEPPSRQSGYCENGPKSRKCWGNYNIDTDVTYEWPNTGVTRYYNFDIRYTTLAPDGVEKRLITVNGQYPGPLLEANWGDDVEVKVCNHLPDNGTNIHWHGIRQFHTNYADGTTSQSECPIAPGDCHTYKWKATQHGSGWYHSHYSLQYSEGLLGPIVIHGPSTADWDIDLGPVLMTDYYHDSVFDIAQRPLVKSLGIPPIAVNGLINGKNNYKKGGQREELKFTKGKKHLLRLANVGSEVTFRFSVDKHKMTVVAADFVPIKPWETKTLLITVGQRYDVIIEADQDEADYWVRAVPMLSCFAFNLMDHDIRAIARYDASSTAEPQWPQSSQWPQLDVCKDEDVENIVPWVPHDVGPSAISKNFDALLVPWKNDSYALRWEVAEPAPYKPLKGNPVVKQVLDAYPQSANVTHDLIPIDLTHLEGTNWIYIVIESFLPLSHPIHLHGHDSYFLARGGGTFLGDGLVQLRTENPMRRDTANLPANGYLVMAFQTDNPGSWLLHCHFEWHLHDGFAMSIIERQPREIKDVYQKNGAEAEMRRVCKNWEKSGLDNRN